MTGKREPESDTRHSPPVYTTLFPQPADAGLRESPQASASPPRQPTPLSDQKVEDIDTLRQANSRLALDPPLPQSTSFKTAEAAARTAMLGVGRAFKQYKNDLADPALIAAHTAHAIALAVSTSHSYTAFVAATTSAESTALLIAETVRHKIPQGRQLERLENAICRAVESALAAEVGNTTNGTWPTITHDTDAT